MCLAKKISSQISIMRHYYCENDIKLFNRKQPHSKKSGKKYLQLRRKLITKCSTKLPGI